MKHDLTGKRFGRLVVIKHAYLNPAHHQNYWECKCDCGNTTTVNSGHLGTKKVISCGCYRREYQRLKPYEWMYNAILRTAQRKNHLNTMSYDDFLTFIDIDKCHYCNHDIQWSKYQFKKNRTLADVNGYKLDRKDNTIGYIKENCVVCCSLCNMVKGKLLSYDEMLIVGKNITEVYRNRQCDSPISAAV